MPTRKPEIGDKIKFKKKWDASDDPQTDGEVIGVRVDKDEVYVKYVEVKEEWVPFKKIEINTIPTIKKLVKDE